MSANDLARKIRHLRTSQNLTLEQVAQQVGVGKSTVRKWETGQIENMRRDKIANLAAALHTSPGYLMGWEDNTFSINLTPDQQSRILDIFDKAKETRGETNAYITAQCRVNPHFFIKLQKPQSCLINREELESVAKHLNVERLVEDIIAQPFLNDENISTPAAPEYDEGTKRLIDAIVALPPEKKKALADLMGIDHK